MAFSTIQGSGGAPDSFVGTSGVDTITLINSLGNFFLGAQEANDVVAFASTGFTDAGVITGATVKGGSGDDVFNGFVGGAFNGVFFNGNGGVDLFNFAGDQLGGSSIQGGQGADTINVGRMSSSLVNGNRDNDIINVTGFAGTVANSSIFGGQGDDAITIGDNVIGSVVNGDDDDDTIVSLFSDNFAGSTFLGGQGDDTINLSSVGANNAFNPTSGVLIDGGDGTDALTGTENADTILGGAGNDTITTSGGDDVVTGGVGFDNINLTGAPARTTIVFTSTQDFGDTVTGFTTGVAPAAPAANDTDVFSIVSAGFAGAPAAGTESVVVAAAGITAANNNAQTVVADTTAALAGLANETSNRRFFVDTDTGSLFYDADGNFQTAVDRVTLSAQAAGLGGFVANNIAFA